jgi:radical SAM superfamily enzyme YgiQ (UPF0313 family)
MPDILLSTLNARYLHAAFGLRYLMANLGPLGERAAILEFDINQRPIDIAETILARNPRVLGLGVYIWNAIASEQLAAILKRARPELLIVLGGPEVSHEADAQPICAMADYIIQGEGDLAFADLCSRLLRGERPPERIIAASLPDLARVVMPYDLYDDGDIAHRVVYVEASRGCPFSCEFCLSSLDVPVRNFPLDAFLAAMQRLLDRGLLKFKFVDRTFNLNLATGRAILQFFLDRYRPGLFLHFEMIPDRLPESLRETIVKFPAGSLQFEVGIQTFNESVAARIGRKQDNARAEENLRFLRTSTGVHIHADLIAGLPGEDLASFAAGFDRLVALGPHEIQLGLLKRLRGTPIVRRDKVFSMVYAPHPPYEILSTSTIDFATMRRLSRMARYWDMIANSGRFLRTTPLIWADASPFASFLALSDWLHEKLGRAHSIALPTLATAVYEYLTTIAHRAREQVIEAMSADLSDVRGGLPDFLVTNGPRRDRQNKAADKPPARQLRHLGADT